MTRGEKNKRDGLDQATTSETQAKLYPPHQKIVYANSVPHTTQLT